MLYQLRYTPMLTYISPNRNPVQQIRLGKEEGANELAAFASLTHKRGNGMESAASDVLVDRQGLEPRTDRL